MDSESLKLDDVLAQNALLHQLFHSRLWWDSYPEYVGLQSNIKMISRELIRHTHLDNTVEVEGNVTFKGPVVILRHSTILSGAYIIGPALIGEGCTVGPNCFINGHCILGNNVEVGHAAELKCSILMDGCKVFHFSYVGHSILGRNVNVGAGVVTAVRRFDNRSITVRHASGQIDTGRGKFGAIIGDDSQIGIGVRILEGRVIRPQSNVLPGTLVTNNIT